MSGFQLNYVDSIRMAKDQMAKSVKVIRARETVAVVCLMLSLTWMLCCVRVARHTSRMMALRWALRTFFKFSARTR